MFRKTLHWLAETVGLTSEGGDDESKGRRFVPSRLDFSVRSSHGGGNTEGARELDNIDKKAHILEQEQRDN
ncbi:MULTISPECIES: hypothetical protein [Salinibaculum]|uniref:hypothetical protein n=1 Tax=Salinibaculum TaxID=2732368 RepID=UPI0030D414B1